MRRKAVELGTDKELQALGHKASQSLEIDDWIQESLQIAGTEVYDSTVRN